MNRALILIGFVIVMIGRSVVGEPTHGTSARPGRPIAEPDTRPVAEAAPKAEELKGVEGAKVEGSSPPHLANEEAEAMVRALTDLNQAATASRGPTKSDD